MTERVDDLVDNEFSNEVNNETNRNDTESEATADNDVENDKNDIDDKNDINDEESDDLHELSEVPVNTKEEKIYYRAVDDIDIFRAIHRCKADGKNIYFAYSEQDLYIMPIGADAHSQANIDNPEGMDVCSIAVDIYGRIHLLMADFDNGRWFIWRLTEDRQIEKMTDVTAYFETEQIPHWFLVDKYGTYYIQWLMSRDGIIIDSEGELQHKFTLESLEARWTYEAAVGKDGLIYLVYGEWDEKLKIGEFDTETGFIKKEDYPFWFPQDETFSEMSCGTDTNLLLFSPYSGVWAYDQEKGICENRVPLSDIPVTENVDFYPITFLPDGRLLLVETAGKDICFHYIPAGK